MVKARIRQATEKGWIACKLGGVVDVALPNSDTRRGRVIDDGETAPTLDTNCAVGRIEKKDDDFTDEELQRGVLLMDDGSEAYIRKLTPKECFRLQGFPDEYFERAASVCPDRQLYKQAGNSVTVSVIYEIAKRLKV